MPKSGNPWEFTTEQLRNFQDIFIKAREATGKSQMAVAEETGLKQSWISSLERATYPTFNLLDILKICKYYGIEPNQVAAILGFLEAEVDLNPDDVVVIRSFQKQLDRLTPDNQRLATTMIRGFLNNMINYQDEQ